MNTIVEFGDCFNWQSCDEFGHRSVDIVFIDEIEEDPAEVAVYIKFILSDEAKMKQYNFKDHGDVNGIHLYTFTTDEYTYICHYTYADEDYAYLVRHENMS